MPDAASPVLDRPTGERTQIAAAEFRPVDPDVESARTDDESIGSKSVGTGPWGVRRHRAGRRRVRRFVRRHWKGLLLVFVVVMGPISYSYGTYLTAPGTSSTGERTVEWLRDHGGDGTVNRVEQWYYTRKSPGDAVPTASSLPTIPAPIPARGATVSASAANPAPVDLVPLSSVPMRGEGVWTPGEQSVGGAPVLYTTFERPDRGNSSVVAGIVEFDQHLVRTVAVPGTKEPGGTGWSWNSEIPTAQRATLVAAFNSGWKFQHIDGGYFAEGRTPQPLVAGDASLVIDANGSIDIGAWGTDVTMSSTVASVRQNLHLIVDNGKVVSDLKSDTSGKYGVSKDQLQFTWRSGIGITADGNVVFVAGDKMTMSALANSLADAGAVRGMQLDIHTGQVTATLFAPQAGTTTGVDGTKLLPSMSKPVTRYLKTDQRDFFAVFVR